MKQASRIELVLTCGGEKYYRAGGVDYRDSLPTILNESRKIAERLFYSGCRSKPMLFWDFLPYLKELKRTFDGVPVDVSGMWELPYVLITDMDDFYPANVFLKVFEPELKKLLLRFEIDPRTYKCHVRQWDADREPDDSAEHDFFEEDCEQEEDEPDDD